VYNFHPYHTKVPPEVIRTLIEHYTDPGDLVLDAFAGTGMTAVAAREAGRHAIVMDLSPVASFIAGVNAHSHDWRQAVGLLERIIEESESNWRWLYETSEPPASGLQPPASTGAGMQVNYYVWSDLFTCPECAHEFPFFPHGVIHHGRKVETRRAFPCPDCEAELNVRKVKRVLLDGRKKKALVWVNAGKGRKRVNRAPNEFDLELARRAEASNPKAWYPTTPIDQDGYSAKLAQLGDKCITDVSRLLSPRNLIVFSDLWERVGRVTDVSIRNLCRYVLTSVFTVISERQGYFGGGGGMSGNFYMPIVRMEKNVYDVLRRKLSRLKTMEESKARCKAEAIVSTQSATRFALVPDDSIDYIYTDPPFGANIIYSEMNVVLESWLKVRTNDEAEAVIDSSRNRDEATYASLMTASFNEYYRVLKPGRWITVEFHNTRADIWNLFQEVIRDCGFVVAQAGVLDKGSTTILSDIRPGAAKFDLVISAYKPKRALEARFELGSASAENVWSFVASHLAVLPMPVVAHGMPGRVKEREKHLLFDRMAAFFVARGVALPISAPKFYAGLQERFPTREKMYFLNEQLAFIDAAGVS